METLSNSHRQCGQEKVTNKAIRLVFQKINSTIPHVRRINGVAIRLGIQYLAPITLYSLHIVNLGLDLNRANSNSTSLEYSLLGQ
jgi:hypothetical protein